MKERFINVLKIFFIILGVLFLMQILIFAGMLIGFKTFSEPKGAFDKINKGKTKDLKQAIEYIENYKKSYSKYPETINDLKQKNKNMELKYSTSNDFNCYQLVAKYKDKTTKKYEHCSTTSENNLNESESYYEFYEN